MSVLLTPSSVREQSSTAWIETITRTRENNEIQRIEFDGALNLFYALKVKSTPEFIKKTCIGPIQARVSRSLLNVNL